MAGAELKAGSVVIASDLPYQQIIAVAKKRKCDLIVMASHGRRGLTGLLLGSETVKVLIRFSYPIHFERRGQTYEIVADWWGVRGVKRDQFVSQVLQRYAYHAARAKLEEQGFDLIEEVQEKGQIRLVLRRVAG